MPVQNDLGVGKRFVQLGGGRTSQLIAVRHDDPKPLQLDLCHLGKLCPNVMPIHVAKHRGYRDQSSQFNYHIPRPHVPTMEDVVDLLEDIEHLRAKQPVSVGYDAESH